LKSDVPEKPEKWQMGRGLTCFPPIAIIYSIVVSGCRRGIVPLAYLHDVLTRLPAMGNRDDLPPLTPANWQPAQQS
jgi:hypothetical protein